jgi:hypothetical protein
MFLKALDAEKLLADRREAVPKRCRATAAEHVPEHTERPGLLA